MTRLPRMGFPLTLCALLAGAGLSQEPPTPMERLSIEDGSGADGWGTAEATASTSGEHAKRGDSTLLFHIDVNHTTGQPDYPIGWPRMFRDISEELSDWRGHDFLELAIHTETNRESLPTRSLGLIIYVPDKPNAYNRNLSELKVGETVRIVIPLSEIPRHENATRMQFFISESEYRHGDVLDFYIDEIALTRFAAPALSEAQPLQSIAYDDATHLGVRFRLLGVAQGEAAVVTARLRHGNRAIATNQWRLERGTHEVWLELTSRPKPGEATLELSVADAPTTSPIRIIPSPFSSKGGG